VSPNVTKTTTAFVKVILPFASRGSLITLGFVAGMLLWKTLSL
jgi:hypothetical protein